MVKIHTSPSGDVHIIINNKSVDQKLLLGVLINYWAQNKAKEKVSHTTVDVICLIVIILYQEKWASLTWLFSNKQTIETINEASDIDVAPLNFWVLDIGTNLPEISRPVKIDTVDTGVLGKMFKASF